MGLSLFSVICFFHCLIALSIGTLMMFHIKDIYTFTHGIDAATKLLGSTPKDQLLIRTSESFSGLLLFAIGFLLFMVSFVKEREFQSFFAKGCVVLHLSMAIWRFHFESRVQFLLVWDWLRLILGGLFAISITTYQNTTKQGSVAAHRAMILCSPAK